MATREGLTGGYAGMRPDELSRTGGSRPRGRCETVATRYDEAFEQRINALKSENRYRHFIELERNIDLLYLIKALVLYQGSLKNRALNS